MTHPTPMPGDIRRGGTVIELTKIMDKMTRVTGYQFDYYYKGFFFCAPSVT